MQDFKQRLASRREKLGLTQIALAMRSGVSERAIAGYETGGDPSYSRLIKLAEALGVTPAWLIGGENEPMVLREGEAPRDLELWRERAKKAEKQLSVLRSRLREALDESASLPVESKVNSKPLSEAQEILKRVGDKYDREHPGV